MTSDSDLRNTTAPFSPPNDDEEKIPRDLLPVPAERDLYSVNAFCARHSLSRDKLYEMWREGLGPEFVFIGNRRMVTRESAARWRMALERAERRKHKRKS